jgi:hypothetical protein
MTHSTRLLLSVLAAASLAAASCRRGASEDEVARLREENEALKQQLTGQPGATAGTPADATAGKPGADDWSWASEASPPAPPPPAPPPARVEPPQPTPIEQPAPRPPRRKPQPPPPPAPEPPTNLFEKPQPAPAPPPAPRVAVRTAPSGTPLTLRLESSLDSGASQVGDTVRAQLVRDVVDVEGRVVLPAGTWVTGRVTEAEAARKVHKKSRLAFHFDRAEMPDGTQVAVSAGQRLDGEGWRKKDGAIIGGSAAGGAVLGQVLGGDSEATAAGAILGGAIASGVLASKKGEDVVVPAGTEIELPLDTEVRVERSVS